MNLARGFEVLRAFTVDDPTLGNKELAERTGLPKATVCRLTYTLTRLGYLNRNSVRQSYSLAPAILTLVYPVLAAERVRQLARPFLERLAAQTSCTVNLGTRDRTRVIYLDTVRADTANAHLPDVGTAWPLLKASIGRALILSYPPGDQVSILNQIRLHDADSFERYRPTWEHDRERFAKQGYCLSLGEFLSDVVGVSVPLRLPAGEPRAAVSCTMSRHLVDPAAFEQDVAAPLLQTCRSIETASAGS